MGMYTEIYVNVNLKEPLPPDVLGTLYAMCDGYDVQLPEDKPGRWAYLFNDGSFYTPSTRCANLTYSEIGCRYSLLGKGDIKNYDGEIEAFFNWLAPYVDGFDGDFIGYSRYEEQQLPTLFVLKGDKAVKLTPNFPRT